MYNEGGRREKSQASTVTRQACPLSTPRLVKSNSGGQLIASAASVQATHQIQHMCVSQIMAFAAIACACVRCTTGEQSTWWQFWKNSGFAKARVGRGTRETSSICFPTSSVINRLLRLREAGRQMKQKCCSMIPKTIDVRWGALVQGRTIPTHLQGPLSPV